MRWDSAHAVLAGNGNEAGRLATTETALDALPGEGTGLLVPSARGAWTERELASVESFVVRGGRVLLLADASLAERFGVAVVRAPIAEPGAEGVPVALDTREGALPGRYPDAMPLLAPEARALARTRSSSIVDVDGDARAGAGDAAGPFTVALAAMEGRVIVAGSARLLDPDALADAEVRATAAALLREAFPAGVRVVLDDARVAHARDALARAPALAALALSNDARLGAAAALAMIAAGALLAADRAGARRSGAAQPDARVSLAESKEGPD